MAGSLGIGGVFAVLRKVLPGLWGLLVNAGSAPYWRGTAEVAEALLVIETQGKKRAVETAEQLAKDYETLWEVNQGLRRSIAELQDSLASSRESSPSTSPPSSSDPPSARSSKRRPSTSS